LSETANAHGLDGTLVEPDWPPLGLHEVSAVLERFPGVSEPVAILSTSPRPLSAASVVQTRTARVFVKRHARVVRDAEGLAEEHLFMRHLGAKGIGVPDVFATGSGGTAVETAEWTYEVHEVPAGVDLYEEAISWTPFASPEHARSAGEFLARMHVAAASFDAPARKVRPLVASFRIFASENPAAALASYMDARPVLADDAATRRDCTEALELLAPFHGELRPWLSALRPLWTHNDMHASNLFWSDIGAHARATAVIDFGLADRTNAVYDIAQAIERNIVEWLPLMRDPHCGENIGVHLDHLWAMLEGYEKVRSLSEAESAALAPMLALGHAEFALTEAHYFLEVLHSPEKARIATRDYLVQHARWFRRPGRDKILDPLRKWAEARHHRAVRA
jgi:Ser/Thr protein kinase RdoA (MazF antagonist)